MLTWLNAHGLQIVLVAGVIILLTFGRKPLVARAGESAFLLWLAFLVTVVCGLILGWALRDLAQWVTSLPGTFGGIVASIGAIAAVLAGWWAVKMLVDLVRDLLDGKPDGDARKAALWIPTLVPAGFSAAWGIVQHPRGIGTGITAVIIAAISVIFLHKTVKAALASKKWPLPWKWFAVAVSALAGILMIPLYAFADMQVAAYANPWLTEFRILVGFVGFSLLIAAIADAWPKQAKQEKTIVPDGAVRAFAAYGVPALFLCGAIAVGAMEDAATDQGNVIVGSVK